MTQRAARLFATVVLLREAASTAASSAPKESHCLHPGLNNSVRH